jgi:hypothetical protein
MSLVLALSFGATLIAAWAMLTTVLLVMRRSALRERAETARAQSALQL